MPPLRETRKNPFTEQRTPKLYRQRKRSLMPRRLRAFLRLLTLKLQDIVFLTRYAAHVVLFLVVILGSFIHGTDLSYVLQLGPSLAHASSADATLWQSDARAEDIYLTWENVPVSLINEQPAVARSQSITYQVREGDNPQIIAQRFGLDPLTIIWANTEFEENPDLLQLGQTLLIPPVDGVLHTVQLGDSLEAIAAAYQVDQRAIVEYASNNLSASASSVTFAPGQQLVVPGGVKALPNAQQDQPIAAQNEQPLDQAGSTGQESQNQALALAATSTLIVFPTSTSTPRATQTPIPATQIPPTSVAIEPTVTSLRPTVTFIRPTETRVPPTWTPVPPTQTRIPPTITAIPPTLAPFEPTWTPVPPTWTSVPPTWTSVPPTWTSVPPTWTSVPPTWTRVPPTWTPIPTYTPEPTWTFVPSSTPQPVSPSSRAPTSVGYACCSWPVSGRITTQPSSWHMALDILGPNGRPIKSAGAGYIIAAGWDNTGYGYRVIVDHGNGITTLYAHLSSFSVSYGDLVSQGQTIGLLGSTGRSTAPHLHFEVRQNGYRQNPYNWLP